MEEVRRQLLLIAGLPIVLHEVAVPAKAGIHLAGDGVAEPWAPAFATDQVRGLKDHGAAAHA